MSAVIKKLSCLFVLGGSAYVIMELFYRKKSHISMFVAGGIAVALIGWCCNVCKPICKCSVYIRALLGGAIITAVELIIGYIVNIRLKLDVWDYSTLPHNFCGQICLPFSALWILLSLPAMYLGGIIFPKK